MHCKEITCCDVWKCDWGAIACASILSQLRWTPGDTSQAGQHDTWLVERDTHQWETSEAKGPRAHACKRKQRKNLGAWLSYQRVPGLPKDSLEHVTLMGNDQPSPWVAHVQVSGILPDRPEGA